LQLPNVLAGVEQLQLELGGSPVGGRQLILRGVQFGIQAVQLGHRLLDERPHFW